MRYRTIGTDPTTRREVSVLSLGTMLFGTATDEATSFAILDRYVEAGGTFIDTSDNYAFWVDGGQGGESEELLGRWRRSRGVGDEIVIATKLGARPLAPGTSYTRQRRGTVRQGDPRVRGAQPGTARRGPAGPALRAHRGPAVPLQETVEAFAELVAEGTVGLLGASNHWAWRVERARGLAAAAGLPGYEVLQYQHSYLRTAHRPARASSTRTASRAASSGDLLSYLRAEPRPDPGRVLAAAQGRRSPARTSRSARRTTCRARPGGWPRCGRWPGRAARRSTRWCSPGCWAVSCRPSRWSGASSVAQLEESLAAVDLELTAEQRHRLDTTW